MLISQFHKLYKRNGLSEQVIDKFQEIIYSYFTQYGRKFPFREKISPYHVLVSEIMLQQTQTSRVSEKFLAFIKEFPTFKALAETSLDKVLEAWQGLGYNRRAIALHKIANKIVNDYNSKLPEDIETLKKLPQIGHNTASSIVAFAFNKPTFFIEVNIRRVYLYFFFPGRDSVDDKEIMEIIRLTTDINNPRNWYYSLMDYGVMLKKTFPNLHKRSKHYRKSKKFKGSNRQLRAKLLKLLLKKKKVSFENLVNEIEINPAKLRGIIGQLEKEGFIKTNNNIVEIKE